MKRYDPQILYRENFADKIRFNENSKGDWVKYESWMDEAERQHIELTIKTAKEEPKKPTICTDCKRCLIQTKDGNFGIVIAYLCKLTQIDPVTGFHGISYCKDKNKGRCLDFEAKEA